MRIESSDVAAVKAAVAKAIGELNEWPDGWPHEIEAALLDAVLSIRDNYGQSVQQRLSGGSLKASAITEAASDLCDVGVRHAVRLAAPSAEH